MNTSFPSDRFSTTHWSVVINAGNSQSARNKSALNELCQRYWSPLYDFALHRGNTHADAEDLVQGFFIDFLERNSLQTLNREKGRFRAYLLVCFKNYSRNEWKRAARQKRGGGADHLPLEAFQSQLIAAGTPECTYDWALLDRVLAQLGHEMHAKGKREQFDVLKPLLTGDRDDFTYRSAANRLKMSEQAVRQAAMRLRKRFRKLIIQDSEDVRSVTGRTGKSGGFGICFQMIDASNQQKSKNSSSQAAANVSEFSEGNNHELKQQCTGRPANPIYR